MNLAEIVKDRGSREMHEDTKKESRVGE